MKLIHLTDPHFVAAGRRLYGLDPRERHGGDPGQQPVLLEQVLGIGRLAVLQPRHFSERLCVFTVDIVA